MEALVDNYMGVGEGVRKATQRLPDRPTDVEERWRR
jgi:hypothetical protein